MKFQPATHLPASIIKAEPSGVFALLIKLIQVATAIAAGALIVLVTISLVLQSTEQTPEPFNPKMIPAGEPVILPTPHPNGSVLVNR